MSSVLCGSGAHVLFFLTSAALDAHIARLLSARLQRDLLPHLTAPGPPEARARVRRRLVQDVSMSCRVSTC